jgi:hypothetical protein
MTDRDVIVIQGGASGALTPSTVNPNVVHGEGCSSKVPPVQLGNRGYFINFDHTKLMAIEFSGGGDSTNVRVVDISILSDEMIRDQEITGLAVVRGAEDIVYILKGDGTMVNVTVSNGLEATGWGTVVAGGDGYIESIMTLERIQDQTQYEYEGVNSTTEDYPAVQEFTHDGLYASIIRSGVRRIEVLTSRKDLEADVDKHFYVDSGVAFGKRLRYVPEDNSYENPLLNITTATNYTAGETITVTMLTASTEPQHDTSSIPLLTYAGFSTNKRYDFFYDDNGTTKRARFTPSAVNSSTEMEGTFDIDVPSVLQDAESAGADDMLLYQSWWLPAWNVIAGNNCPTDINHLEGLEVAIYASEHVSDEGKVLSSPNNTTEYGTAKSVSSGSVTLDSGKYVNYGVIGLPYDFELETLDLDTSDERTFTDANKLVNSVGIAVYETKGGYLGQTGSGDTDDDLTDMNRIDDARNTLASEVSGNMNGHFEFNIPGGWEKTGRVLVKQADPEPITVLAVYPKGMVSE